MRVGFWQLFGRTADGSITPRVLLSIGGVTLSPGVSFRAGVSFSGVDLAVLAGRDLEVEQYGAVVSIVGHY